jgi:hypothetical protein
MGNLESSKCLRYGFPTFIAWSVPCVITMEKDMESTSIRTNMEDSARDILYRHRTLFAAVKRGGLISSGVACAWKCYFCAFTASQAPPG